MQDGTPCPCCRREFVSLEPHEGETSRQRQRPRSNSEPQIYRPPVFDTSVISLGLPSRGGQRRQTQRTEDEQQPPIFDDRTFDSSVIRFRTPDDEAAERTTVFDDRTFDSSVIRLRAPGDERRAPVFFDGRTFDSSIIRLRAPSAGGDGDGTPRTADEEERAARRVASRRDCVARGGLPT